VALVATSTPAGRRRAALGIQAAAQALGLAAGPVVGGLLVASVGWRWIFFVNVPVGAVAVAAGWFLLPRTRQLAHRRSSDPLGMALLAAAAAGMLIAVSSLSGLGVPLLTAAGMAAAAAGAGAALTWWERRSAAPLIDLPLLTAAGIAPALGGALCAYMVLFGPLVLLPQTLIAHGDSALRAGLLLTALPAGFGLAAVAAERLLPVSWPNQSRCVGGGLVASCSVAALAVPAPAAVTVVSLALLGAGHDPRAGHCAGGCHSHARAALGGNLGPGGSREAGHRRPDRSRPRRNVGRDALRRTTSHSGAMKARRTDERYDHG